MKNADYDDLLVDKWGVPMSESPRRPLSDYRNFFENNNSFFVLALHLFKIEFFPSHQAVSQWRKTVHKTLNFILERCSDSFSESGKVKRFFKFTPDELQSRVEEESAAGMNEAFESMADDMSYLRYGGESDFNSKGYLSDFGYSFIVDRSDGGDSLVILKNGSEVFRTKRSG